jgi:parallel beta-helix repeat protein
MVRVKMENCEIVNATNHGIDCTPFTKVYILLNRFKRIEKNGIHLSGHSSWAKIESNVITDCKGYGIYINDDATGEVIYNEFSRCKRGDYCIHPLLNWPIKQSN